MPSPSLSEQMWIESREVRTGDVKQRRELKGGGVVAGRVAALKAARLTRGLPVAMLSVALPITSVQ